MVVILAGRRCLLEVSPPCPLWITHRLLLPAPPMVTSPRRTSIGHLPTTPLVRLYHRARQRDVLLLLPALCIVRTRSLEMGKHSTSCWSRWSVGPGSWSPLSKSSNASMTIRCYHPKDFITSFSSYGVMARVLHRPPPSTSLILVFKWWHRQLLAMTKKLLFLVVVRISGISAHVWHPAMAQQILSPSCSCIQPTASNLAKTNLRWYTVRGCCLHLDLIPMLLLFHIPEPVFRDHLCS
jgi:hypothetical protein